MRDEAAAAGTLVWDPYDPAWVERSLCRLRRAAPEQPGASQRARVLGLHPPRRLPGASCATGARAATGATSTRPPSASCAPVDLPRQQGPEAMLAEMAPFLFRDPPDHTRLRGLVQKAFTPEVVEGLRPRLEEICDGLLDDALERGEVDLVADYAYPLPVQIIVEMLGVPGRGPRAVPGVVPRAGPGARPRLPASPRGGATAAGGHPVVRAVLRLAHRGAAPEARRRPAHPADPGRGAGRRAHPGRAAVHVHLAARGRARDDGEPHLGRGARPDGAPRPAGPRPRRPRRSSAVRVEEMLRFVCPVQLTGRVALEDMEVGGARDRQGRVLDAAHRVGQPRPRRLRRPRRPST